MDGSSSGNPSAPSSRSLPVHAADGTLITHCVLQSPDEDQQSREVGSLTAETDQSPAETHQSPPETHQSPAETHQTPETHQSPAESPQSPAEPPQSPAEPPQSPAETHQSPAEAHQSPAETDKSPAETDKSAAEAHQSPAETDQSPVETQHNPVKKGQCPARKHQNSANQSPVKKQQSTETNQSPVKKQQSTETNQSPVKKQLSTETNQSPVKKQLSTETNQSPVKKQQSTETNQSPVKKQQSTETNQSPAEKQNHPVKKDHCPARKHQSSAKKHQKSANQSPVKKRHSPAETHQSLTEDLQNLEEHQCLAETQQTEEEPDSSVLTKDTNHQHPPTQKQQGTNSASGKDKLKPLQSFQTKLDPPKLYHKEPGDSSGPKHEQEPGHSKQRQNQYPPPPNLNPQKAPLPPSPSLNTQKAPPPPFPKMNTQKAPPPPPPNLNTEKAPPLPSPNLNTEKAPPPPFPKLNTQKAPPPPPPNLNTEKAPPLPPPNLNTEKAPPPPPPNLNTEKAPPPPSPDLNTEKAPPPPPPNLNAEKAPPPPSPNLNTQKAPPPPPPNLNTEKAPPPPSPNLNTEKAPPPPSPDLNTEKAPPPPSPNLNTEKAPPPPSPDLNTEKAPPPPSPDLNTEKAPPPPPPSPNLNTEKAPPPPFPKLNTQKASPPPPKLNTQQTPPPHLNPEHAPPPTHLNTNQTPSLDLNNQQTPPSLDLNTQQNYPCSPAQELTMAPPLTIEAFCDQAGPRAVASSSGEPKLCGFLQKQGGPLRAWKQRWFTYEEKQNQLFYYRTPQDVMPLGRVELSGATFTYPLKAEKGTFHIKTPERTFILKAVTQELMLYWLQQLQVKRWQHRQISSCSDPTNNNNSADEFLPVLKSPLGLVGEEAANVSTQRTPLANMSLKHPLIEIQNSVHSLRKRSSQEWSQSVFHVENPGSAADNNNTIPSDPGTPIDAPTPPPPLLLADPGGQVSPAEGRESPSLFDGRSRKKKSRSMSTMPVRRRDTVSSPSRLQHEKEMLMEEVKAQKELVWILHKALEAAQLEKRTCAEFLAEEDEQERLELLRHRERQAADLRSRLEEAKMEAEVARRSKAQSDAQLADLQDNIRLLKEKNNAKQEVIIKLSDQVSACLSDARRSGSSSGSNLDSQPFRQLQQEVENLKDDIEAYKTQNKFLNSEIFQLTKLWRKSSEQEKSLMVKCAYLEATNCQVESRYLGVLRKLQETKTLDPIQKEAVQKMIETALKGELKSVVKLSVDRDYDEYGFKIVPDYEVEDMKLLAKIQALEIRSHNLLHQEAVERPLLSRWAHYLAGRSDDNLCASPELKALVRGGVHPEYRQRVWRWLIRARTWTIREHHPQRYQQLCEKSRTSPHPASRQIQLDLHRTLTTNQYFSSPSSPALQQLRRVLLAFSWHSPAIGYCQGLNRLAAIALLVLQSEEEAFWCLVSVVESIMPQDYYTKNLVASQADQRVLKDFLAEKLPRLAAHFEDHSIDVSLITFNWFLVVFVESLPSDILLPLWDAFLYEGTKVIFRYALALFKYKEDDILKIHDSVEIYQYLRFFTKTISDGRKLTSIAFTDMNPFPRRLLRNRRALHLERLQAELRELEEQQREFVTESAERKDKELDVMMSEDDEEL